MSGLLWAHISVLVNSGVNGDEEDSATAKQMREWSPAVSSQPDDYLDSAAGAITDQPERVGKIHRTNEVNERPNWRTDGGVAEATLDFND